MKHILISRRDGLWYHTLPLNGVDLMTAIAHNTPRTSVMFAVEYSNN